MLLPSRVWGLPGDVVIGADSHTCTYGALGAFATGVGSTDLASAMATARSGCASRRRIKFVYHGKLPWVGGKDLILHTIGDIGVDGALYCAMEFHGEALAELPMADRFTMCNMAIEAGGKTASSHRTPDTGVRSKPRASETWKVYQPDPGRGVQRCASIDCSELEPQVAFPLRPANARPSERGCGRGDRPVGHRFLHATGASRICAWPLRF